MVKVREWESFKFYEPSGRAVSFSNKLALDYTAATFLTLGLLALVHQIGNTTM